MFSMPRRQPPAALARAATRTRDCYQWNMPKIYVYTVYLYAVSNFPIVIILMTLQGGSHEATALSSENGVLLGNRLVNITKRDASGGRNECNSIHTFTIWRQLHSKTILPCFDAGRGPTVIEASGLSGDQCQGHHAAARFAIVL